MILSREAFAKQLRTHLESGYDPIRLARWAFELHLSARAFDEGVEDRLLQLIAMDMGEEFELDLDTLNAWAQTDG